MNKNDDKSRNIRPYLSLSPLGEDSPPSGEKEPPVMEDTALLTALARAMDPSLWEQPRSEPGSIRLKSPRGAVPEELIVPPFLDGRQILRLAPGALAESSVRKVILPEGIREVGADAFAGCSLLEEIVLPDSMALLEPGCFSSAPRVARVELPDRYRLDRKLGADLAQSGLPGSCRLSFRGTRRDCREPVFPAGIRRVEQQAFAVCENMRRAVLPEGIEEIGNFAFFGCSDLAEIVLPSTLRRIGEEAFVFCPSLTEILLPDRIESLGKLAFWFCVSLKRAEFPASWKGRQEEIEAAGFPEGCAIIFR